MTRSVTIVNTSNWDHEDYIVHTGDIEGTRLRPGEKMSFTPVSGQPMTIEAVSDKEAVPIYRKAIKDGSAMTAKSGHV